VADLPLALRLALWGTRWLHGQATVEEVVERTHAGLVTDATGDVETVLADWAEAGETAVFLAIPRPGAPAGMPPAHPDALGAATAAGQAAYAPTVGGLLVPAVAGFGSDGDRGLLASWTAYPAQPVPRHVAEATDLRDLSRRLAEAVQETTERLAAAGGIPWRGWEATTEPRRHVPGLPDRLAPRAVHLLDRADTVAGLAVAGLEVESDGAALDASTSLVRATALRRLLAEAQDVLVGATNVLAMEIAGWRPA